MSEAPRVYVGDAYGFYEDGFFYIREANAICIVKRPDIGLSEIIHSLNHEYLHFVICELFDSEEANEINLALDYSIFADHRWEPDLSEDSP